MGRPPKPAGQKRNRAASTAEWTELPATRRGRTPPLPDWRDWSEATRRWWKSLWRKPQAAMWDPDGMSLWTLAALFEHLHSEYCEDAVKVAAEMRQHENAHGLNPKGMRDLRWRYSPAEPEPAAAAPAAAAGGRYRRLRVVDETI